MMIEDFFRLWRRVFGHLRVFFVFLLTFLLFYLLNVLIKNYSSLVIYSNNSGFIRGLNLFFILSIGFYKTIKIYTFVGVLIIGFLLATLVGLIYYRYSMNMKLREDGLLGGFGAALGIVAPGCSACAVGLAPVFGLGSGAFSLLPYGGFEFTFIAIILLGYSIYRLSREMVGCEIRR